MQHYTTLQNTKNNQLTLFSLQLLMNLLSNHIQLEFLLYEWKASMSEDEAILTNRAVEAGIAKVYNKSNYTARRWVFTSFYDDPPQYDESTIRYLIYQRERSPTTGRLHWQGYAECHKSIKAPQFQRALQIANSWCCGAKGNKQQCIDYCSKTDTRESDPVEHGDRNVVQGARTDLDAFREAVLNGATERQLCDEHIAVWARHQHLRRRIEEAHGITQRRSGAAINVEVRWGSTGTGKTYTATEQFGNGNYYMLRNYGNLSGATVWSGYELASEEAKKNVVIDEFYGWARWEELLGWLDRYPTQVRVHGGMCELIAENIIITSNSHPKEWYSKIIEEGKVKYETLRRRITKIVHYNLPLAVGISRPRIEVLDEDTDEHYICDSTQ